ncbi:MAG: IS21 family transposase [Actinomycetota bacterium]|nr:IS21 family transposase [Actinomycetota bacterium]
MLTQENDVEIHALHARGWNQSAISRHTGRDRKTVRKYLTVGEVVRERAASCLEPWRGYIAARFVDDPHLPAVTLLDELAAAGFQRSYPTLVRELRRTELRPVCLVCEQRRGNAPTTEIDHPPGEEIQWDWLELPVTPWEQPAYLLVGAWSHSGRFRAVFCEQMTVGHLAGALHEILVGLGGSGLVWRVDRMATAVIPGTDRLNPQFAQLAKHYGVDVAICPAHRPQRKGVVEAAIKFIAGRWWRTARAASMLEAQQSLGAFTVGVSDRRGRRGSTVGELGATEPLRALPALAFPAEIMVQRVASRSALVLFETNKYSVPPGYAGQPLTVRARVGEPHLRIQTTSGIKVATHRRAPTGAEQTIRTSEHATQLERAVLDAFTTQTACRSKTNRPPGDRALAELAKLHGLADNGRAPVVSLTDYAELAEVACG